MNQTEQQTIQVDIGSYVFERVSEVLEYAKKHPYTLDYLQKQRDNDGLNPLEDIRHMFFLENRYVCSYIHKIADNTVYHHLCISSPFEKNWVPASKVACSTALALTGFTSLNIPGRIQSVYDKKTNELHFTESLPDEADKTIIRPVDQIIQQSDQQPAKGSVDEFVEEQQIKKAAPDVKQKILH